MNWETVTPDKIIIGQTIKNYGKVYHVTFLKGKYVVFSKNRRPTYYTIEDTLQVSG